MVMIDFEKAQEMIACEKFVVIDGETRNTISLDQAYPMHCRLELTTNGDDFSFIWDIKQSSKNTIRLSLHLFQQKYMIRLL